MAFRLSGQGQTLPPSAVVTASRCALKAAEETERDNSCKYKKASLQRGQVALVYRF